MPLWRYSGTGNPRETAFLYQRISVAIQRYNAMCLANTHFRSVVVIPDIIIIFAIIVVVIIIIISVINIQHVWWSSRGRGRPEVIEICSAGTDLYLCAHSHGNFWAIEHGRISVPERTWKAHFTGVR